MRPAVRSPSQGNTFGQLFMEAAEKADAKTCSDGFDSSVIEVGSQACFAHVGRSPFKTVCRSITVETSVSPEKG